MWRIVIIAGTIGILAACNVAHNPPAISAISDTSVTVDASLGTPQGEIANTAAKGCAKFNRVAEFLSVTTKPYGFSTLFVCVDP